MKKYIKSTRSNLVYTIERQEYSETFRTPENYFKHATRAAWYSVNASFNVFVYYKGIYYMAERTDNHGVITTLEFIEISAEQAAAIEAKNAEEHMTKAEAYERDTANAAIEYDAESATEYAKQGEFSATVAESYASRAAEYAAEAGTTEAASAADAAAEYAAFARSYADSATETAEQAAAEAAQRAAWLEANPEQAAYIEAEATAHNWSAKETAENVEYWATIHKANRAALALLDAYAEAIGEHPHEDDDETHAAYKVARDEIIDTSARATEYDRATVDAMVEAIADRATQDADEDRYTRAEQDAAQDWSGEGWYSLGYSDGATDTNPHYWEGRDELASEYAEMYRTATAAHLPTCEYYGDGEEPADLEAGQYQRHELEAFLGEYVDAYDVDAIEAEATTYVYSEDKRYWRKFIDLAAIAERHERRPDFSRLELDAAAQLMDDDIREELHASMAPCSPAEFLAAYEAAHFVKFGTPFQYA